MHKTKLWNVKIYVKISQVAPPIDKKKINLIEDSQIISLEIVDR